ncbi:DUF4350 domain-containing protein [Leifsonia sp. NPDC058230]|uniref:DUF4350 domain-containing protein n=1 Tax=Leifsonia sp. NPDC058230 TaxID=3346391 RepID=UPI0036DA2339
MTGTLDGTTTRPGHGTGTESGPSAEATAITPTVRQAGRRSIPWIVLAVIAVLVALVGILFSGRAVNVGTPLDLANPGPVGSQAVVEVLRQQGVGVFGASTLDEVRGHATDDTTVLVYDPDGNLDADGYDSLTSVASTIVVVEPGFRTLEQLAPGVDAAGRPSGSGVLAAGCSVPAAVAAGRIDPHPTGNTEGATVPGTFRLGDSGATGCFRSSTGQYSLVESTVEGRTVFLLGSASILMNDGAARSGNAALAFNLLGEHRTLVWYLPSVLDRPVTGPPDLSALTPGWVTPVVILLIVVAIAAAFWRGRRFGPLVIENLPVVVRAGETREGRARLYQRSSARLRAADSLRIGSLGRLAGLAGLPQAATTTEIADAVAAITGRERTAIRGLLLDDVPGTDAQLIALSDHLAELERATAAAVSPTTGGPTGRMDA